MRFLTDDANRFIFPPVSEAPSLRAESVIERANMAPGSTGIGVDFDVEDPDPDLFDSPEEPLL